VGLCFAGSDFLAGTRCVGLGEPTRSRAISRTVVAAEKVFFFRFRAMGIHHARRVEPLLVGIFALNPAKVQ